MPQFAALLRGIAPSGRNMTNDKLRGVFERLGFTQVASVLASGNIVFRCDTADTAVLEQRIEDALATDLGLSSRTILRAHADLRALLDSDPFPGLTHGRATYLTATFLKDPATAPDVVPEHPDSRLKKVWIDEQLKPGLVDWPAVQARLREQGIVLVGGGADEAPEVYKRLPDVLAAHGDTIRVKHTLHPLGVAMAGRDVHDPYKD